MRKLGVDTLWAPYGVHGVGLLWIWAGLSGCLLEKHPILYKPWVGEWKARIHSELSATSESKSMAKSPKVFQARSEALVRLRSSEQLDGTLAMELHIDSVNYFGSDRDDEEQNFMRERLGRYLAKWRLARNGQILAMTEDPQLPRGDFTCRFGPLLASSLPVFRTWTSKPAQDTQSFFDPAEPGAFLMQIRKTQDEKTGKTGNIEWEGKRQCVLRINATEGITDLKGPSAFTFQESKGFPRLLTMKLEGNFPSESDTLETKRPIRLLYTYRFEVLEFSPPLPPL